MYQKPVGREMRHQTLSSLSEVPWFGLGSCANGLTGTSDKRAMNLTAAMGIQSGGWSQHWRGGCSQRSERSMIRGHVALMLYGMRALRQAAREMSA